MLWQQAALALEIVPGQCPVALLGGHLCIGDLINSTLKPVLALSALPSLSGLSVPMDLFSNFVFALY